MDYRERWELKEYRSERRLSRRMLLVHGFVAVVLLAYLLTFWYLQMVRGDEYRALAENNRLRRIPVPPTRGVVLDRNSQVLASTRPALNLILVREGLSDADEQLRRLEEAVGVPYEATKVRLKAMRSRPTFEPLILKEDVTLAEVAKIESRREWFPSVVVQQTSVRDYPDGRAIAHAVGYVGEVTEEQLGQQPPDGTLQQGDIVGKAGLERSYDVSLRGRRGWRLVTVNNLGRQLGDARPGQTPEDGHGLATSIDVRLQRTLVQALGAEVGAGVFMNPWNGEVLALASTPAYDPNMFAGPVGGAAWQSLIKDPNRPLHDRAIGSFYAPGSTFKILMAIIGLETGVITPSTIMHCGGSINLYGRPFLCWKKGGHGAVDLHQALVHSCNVFFYQVGKAAGIDKITEYGNRFHLGRTAGIDLPGESKGVLPSDAWKRERYKEPWYAGDTISVSIGQGLLAVTPLQMATLVSAVANGGKLPRPHVVRIDDPEMENLNIAPGTLALIRSALADVVEEGTGQRASLGSISVAGKTGTAQVLKKSAGVDADKQPKEERDHAWFVGYAPADKPEIAFAVVIEHGGHGGTTAAPVVRQVLETYFAERLPPKKADASLQAGMRRTEVPVADPQIP